MRYYSSTAPQMALQGSVTGANTTLQVDTVAGLPGSYPFTVVIDPGHSGADIVNDQDGMLDHDYPSANAEMAEVWDVSNRVKASLEQDGYTVIMTKGSVDASVSHWRRAEIANNANAALAISIHNDHGQTWNSFGQVYDQRVG